MITVTSNIATITRRAFVGSRPSLVQLKLRRGYRHRFRRDWRLDLVPSGRHGLQVFILHELPYVTRSVAVEPGLHGVVRGTNFYLPSIPRAWLTALISSPSPSRSSEKFAKTSAIPSKIFAAGFPGPRNSAISCISPTHR